MALFWVLDKLDRVNKFWIGKVVDRLCAITGRNNFAVAGWIAIIATICYSGGWFISMTDDAVSYKGYVIAAVLSAIPLVIGVAEAKDCFECEERLDASSGVAPTPAVRIFIGNRVGWTFASAICLPWISIIIFGMFLAGVSGYAQLHINRGGTRLSERVKDWLRSLGLQPTRA